MTTLGLLAGANTKLMTLFRRLPDRAGLYPLNPDPLNPGADALFAHIQGQRSRAQPIKSC